MKPALWLVNSKPYGTVEKMDRPASTRKDQRRDAILAVAAQVFFEEGFQAASMSNIAARLGGSKGTLYSYFDSKEALFEAHIRETCGRIATEVFEFSDNLPARAALTELGQRFLDLILSDWAVRTLQIIIAEARRSPDLARMFFQAGPLVARQRLARFLEVAASRGEVDIDDYDEAAWQFLGMCRIHHLEATLELIAKPPPKAIARQVAWAVETFMLRYGPK